MSAIPLPPAPAAADAAPAASRAAQRPAEDPRRVFDAKTIALFEEWTRKFPDPKAALIPILHVAQEAKGWLSRETLLSVAAFLRMPPIQVWEVATFYPMFHLEAVGRHVVWICRNISCDLRGASAIVEAVHGACGARPGQTSADGRVTVKLAECLGGCASAPVVEVDGAYHENLDPAKARALVLGLP